MIPDKSSPLMRSDAVGSARLDQLATDFRFQSLGQRRTILPGRHLSLLTGAVAPVIIVCSGSVSLHLPTRDGRDVYLADLTAGDLLGEADAPSVPANALDMELRVEQRSTLWILTKEQFIEAVAVHDDFARAAINALFRNVSTFSAALAEKMALAVRDRLCNLLLKLAEPSPDGTLIISRLPTHEGIATRIASQREAVTKELGRLEHDGVIFRRGKIVTVLSPARLKRVL